MLTRLMDSRQSPLRLHKFIDQLNTRISQHKKIKKKVETMLSNYRVDGSHLVEDMVMELTFKRQYYDEDKEAESLMLQEKFKVLQDLVTPALLDIPL